MIFKKEFFAPQPILRIELLRIFLPLAILGFLSSRLINPTDWLSNAGFHVPELGHKDWRQPLFLPPLPVWLAIVICSTTIFSGLSLSFGFKTRVAAGIFTICLFITTLSDRLEAFTVNKMGTVLALALFLTPVGTIFSIDAWLARKTNKIPTNSIGVTWGNVRFFQLLIVVLYCASGISKMRGDWLHHDHVLWTHLHDSYQTPITYWVATHFPKSSWIAFQYAVLIFETGAPLWFAAPLPYLKNAALFFALAMHLFIGLCFGPVIWFAILMNILVFTSFAPFAWLETLTHVASFKKMSA